MQRQLATASAKPTHNLIAMIATRKNPNFSNWIQVFFFGRLVDEVTGNAKALRLANELGKKHKQTHINHLGEAVKVR
ncbi:MAG: hypothetical protein CME70_00980 [Halobacteriovorax sp.]|nr:hypothetical protein [Halobacteriovorax sp.]